MLKDIFCLRQQHCRVEEENEGMGEGKREEKERASSASKQVPAPSAPTYKNLFLLPHVTATHHLCYHREHIKNLFMALSGPVDARSVLHTPESIFFAAVSKQSDG